MHPKYHFADFVSEPQMRADTEVTPAQSSENVLLEVASYPRPSYGHAGSGKILKCHCYFLKSKNLFTPNLRHYIIPIIPYLLSTPM